MTEPPLRILCVIGTSAAKSAMHTVLGHIAHRLQALGADVDVFDQILNRNPDCFSIRNCPIPAHQFLHLKERVERTDTFRFSQHRITMAASPARSKTFSIISGRNSPESFLRRWFALKRKALPSLISLRTVARQCYAWTLPYGVSFASSTDLQDGEIISAALDERIECSSRTVKSMEEFSANSAKPICPVNIRGFSARMRQRRAVAEQCDEISPASLVQLQPQT